MLLGAGPTVAFYAVQKLHFNSGSENPQLNDVLCTENICDRCVLVQANSRNLPLGNSISRYKANTFEY